MRPASISAIRSASEKASSWSCVTRTTVTPAVAQDARDVVAHGAAQRAGRCCSRARRGARSTAPGRARGRARRAAAGRRRARAGGARSRPPSPTSRAPRPRAPRGGERGRPKPTFSATDEVGEERVVLEDHAHVAALGRDPGAVPLTARPSIRTRRRRAARSPAISRSIVVLPQPLGPSTASISPRSTRQAAVVRRPSTAPKRLVTPSSSIMGVRWRSSVLGFPNSDPKSNEDLD